MDDIAAVKVELKIWERTFKTKHGRDPSVQDIKDHPAIAERYKLYKRLSKFAAAASPSTAPSATAVKGTPSTPRRTKFKSNRAEAGPSHLGSTVLQKARAVPTEAPVQSSNPFSPSKKSRRSPNPTFSTLTSLLSPPSASSSKAQSASKFSRFASPDPFSDDVLPSLHAPLLNPSTSSPSAAAQPELVRARKRLRGEPVSPSPSKDKRRRVTSRPTAAFSRLDSDDDAFIDDSPVKPSRYTDDQAFASLFNEETIPSPNFTGRVTGVFRRSASASSDAQSFDSRSIATDEPPNTDFEDDDPSGPNILPTWSSRPPTKVKKAVGPRTYLSDDLTKPKDNPAASGGTSIVTDGSPARSVHTLAFKADGLLPPSPSATKSSRPKYGSDKKGDKRLTSAASGKQKHAVANKAPPLTTTASASDDAGGETDVDDDPQVRIYDWNASRRALLAVQAGDPTSDFDPEFDFALSRRQKLVVNPPFEEDADEGAVEVDIPDHLKSVLALPLDRPAMAEPERAADADDASIQQRPAAGRSRRRQQALVQAVISGSRFGHYDSARGGEIWDAGEVTEEDAGAGDTNTATGTLTEDDDWEGEGMPWEVGEL